MKHICFIVCIVLLPACSWALDLSMLNPHFLNEAHHYFIPEALHDCHFDLVVFIEDDSYSYSHEYLMLIHILILLSDSDNHDNKKLMARNVTIGLGNKVEQFFGVLGIGGMDVIIDIGNDKALRLPHLGQFFNTLKNIPTNLSAKINEYDPQIQEGFIYSAHEYLRGYEDFHANFSSKYCKRYLPHVFLKESLLPFYVIVEKLYIAHTLLDIALSKNVWKFYKQFVKKGSPYRRAWKQFARFLGQISNNPDISLSNIALVVIRSKYMVFKIIDFHRGVERKRTKQDQFLGASIHRGWVADILSRDINAEQAAGSFALLTELAKYCDDY